MYTLRIIFFLTTCLCFVSCDYVRGLLGQQQSGEPVVVAGNFEIQLVADQNRLKFIPELIIAKPGQVLKLKVSNQLKEMPIVFSILKKDEDPIVNAFLGVQAGESNQWAPPKEHVLIPTQLLVSNSAQSFKITLPTDLGEYSFISSYPGQVDNFNGLIKIEADKK